MPGLTALLPVVQIAGGIHTYLELFTCYFVDLKSKVALVVAAKADRQGNSYTGQMRIAPAIVEVTVFRNGLVTGSL